MRKRSFLRLIPLCFIILFSILFLNFRLFSQEPIDPMGKQPPIEQIGKDEYRIGSVILNKNRREISLPGSVNMQSGLIEYLACHNEMGKLHESVLKIDAKPSDLQVALLLLGLKNKNNLQFQGDPTVPEGDLLDIFVEWELPDKTMKRVRAEELAYDQYKKKPMDQTSWVFTGSEIVDGQFMADKEGSIIATFRDPLAIINNPLPTGADDTVYVSNEKLVPPKDTKVYLVIKPVEEEKGHSGSKESFSSPEVQEREIPDDSKKQK